MADNDNIRRLFHTVLYEGIRYHRLNHDSIRTGIQNMKEVYKPKPTSLSSESVKVADYDDPAHRCAYLHKYAPLHTALVSDMLSKSMQQVRFILQEILTHTGRIEVCSLGGGPGSDILGVISVLSDELGFFQLSVTIIDIMEKWKHTFGAIIKELRRENYGFISEFVQPQYFSWNYIGHNLLGKMTNDVNKAIQGANLVTMVKFISAAACKDTAEMVKKIFNSMKPGALILFIDNAAGGFSKLVSRLANQCQLRSVFGPLEHELYYNETFNVTRYDHKSCYKTKVTVHLLMKPCVSSTKKGVLLLSRSIDGSLQQSSFSNMSDNNGRKTTNDEIRNLVEQYEYSDDECRASSDSLNSYCSLDFEESETYYFEKINLDDLKDDDSNHYSLSVNQEKLGCYENKSSSSRIFHNYLNHSLPQNEYLKTSFGQETKNYPYEIGWPTLKHQSGNQVLSGFDDQSKKNDTEGYWSLISFLLMLIPSIYNGSNNLQLRNKGSRTSFGFEIKDTQNYPYEVEWPTLQN